VGEEILLSCPSVLILDRDQAAEKVQASAGRLMCAVKQEFDMTFKGEAVLVFPEDRSLALVRTILSEVIDVDDMTDLEQETLIEVGNVVINACLGSMVDQLNLDVSSSIPEFIFGEGAEILGLNNADDDGFILFLEINFTVSRLEIQGCIVMIFDLSAAGRIKSEVDRMIETAER